MIQRSLLAYLREWKRSNTRKPLVLRGARQVGKSTLINEFGKEYDVYLKLNLDETDDYELFERYFRIDELIDAIYLHCKQKKEGGTTLLFIDEIQNSPRAVAMLRYFYEQAPHLHVVAAGSLLESLIDKTISFPVGRVQYVAMRPCSFLEFLDGIGESFDKESVENLQADKIHERVMRHFKNYCIVGGMPEAVAGYAESKDILALDEVYDTLIASYSDDVEKYAANATMTQALRFILQNGWTYGGSTISFERFANSAYRSREMGEAFRTIEKAMLLELVYPVTSSLLPLQPAFTRRPKLIWLDTGLVNYIAGVRSELFNSLTIQDAWRGKSAEHIVAQELLACSQKVTAHRYFWVNAQKGSDAEVDFVIDINGMVVPVEVKSGINTHLRSLHSYMDMAPHDVAVRVWSNLLSVDEVTTPKGKRFRLVNLPFYYVGVIEKVLTSLV
ncbi:MAG: AAA family ATPase [Mediterranea sp.]|nr:AAA family ATPase [Mediterranea sp.]